MNPILIGQQLTIRDVVRVAREHHPVILAPEAKAEVLASRAYVEKLVAENKTVYGITTGFGKFSNVRIAPEDTRLLQRNLILSHAMGVGEPLAQDVTRAMLLLRAQSLSFGVSGIRVEVIELILECLNRACIQSFPPKAVLARRAISRRLPT